MIAVLSEDGGLRESPWVVVEVEIKLLACVVWATYSAISWRH
jgi:hypothetical protein